MPRRNKRTSKRQAPKVVNGNVTYSEREHSLTRAGFTNICATCGASPDHFTYSKGCI